MLIAQLLPFSWLRGVARTWGDEILPSMGISHGANPLPAFNSPMCPKKHFDFGDLFLVND